jgi:hypothetical protein
MTTDTRRFWIPPWTIILAELVWLWAVYGFVVFALSWHSVAHVIMAAFSLFIVVALYLRWRVGFWISAVGFAAASGATLARIFALGSFSPFLLVSLAVACGAVLVQQAPASLRWFSFERVRTVRLAFWELSSLIGIVAGVWLYHLLTRTA